MGAVTNISRQMLVQATTSPDFPNYLTYLFRTPDIPPSIPTDQATYDFIRVAAALNLKSKVKIAFQTVSPTSLQYIKASALAALHDGNNQVRTSAGNIITEIVQQGGLLAWPDLLNQILALAANSSGSISIIAQEAAMSALQKVCEDNAKLLDKEFEGQRPLSIILPSLMQCTTHTSANIRSGALSTINMFISKRPAALLGGLDTFLNQLFQLASDPNTDVRRMVCKSFTQLVEVCPEKLAPHIEGLVNYILYQQHNADDPELALEAAEFWLVVATKEDLRQALIPHLGKIVPVLLQCMVYDEDDAVLLAGEDDNAEEEDRDQDIKPTFAQGKVSRVDTAKSTSHGAKDSMEEANEEDELSEGEIDDDETEDLDDDPESEWTVRKCSAASLDSFANIYGGQVFTAVLPYLQENLRNEYWAKREAAVLALGAIADGCMESVTPNLPELIPYLISLLNDQVSIVRKITCWCLGRYSEWAAHLDSVQKKNFFEPMMEGLLHRMLDNNKKVQEAAASGFMILEEKSGGELKPYCRPILQQFALCFQRYKIRNMFVLYDCIQNLAQAVMSELAKPELSEILMPVLVERWHKLPDQSQEIFALLDCLGYVATAFGEAFSPYALPMYSRAINIIYSSIQEYISAVNTGGDEPQMDFLISSLDLISAIIQAIGPERSSELVTTTQPNLFELLRYCLEDPNSEVRISAFALLGDSAIYVFPQLRPFILVLMPILIRQLDLDLVRMNDVEYGLSIVTNACWSCGEIAVNLKEGMAPYLQNLYLAFLAIMANEDVPESVHENATVALGRLGLGCAEQLGPHLANFAGLYLKSIENLYVSPELASSLLGFNQIIKQNPEAMETCLSEYFNVVAKFQAKTLNELEYAELRQSFLEVMTPFIMPLR